MNEIIFAQNFSLLILQTQDFVLPDGKVFRAQPNLVSADPKIGCPREHRSPRSSSISVKEKDLNNWCFNCDLTLPPSRTEATSLPDGKHSAHNNCFGCRVPPIRRALATGQLYFCNARQEGFMCVGSKSTIIIHHSHASVCQHVIKLCRLSLSSIRPSSGRAAVTSLPAVMTTTCNLL